MSGLDKFIQDFPRLTAILMTAEQNRQSGQFLGGDRSRGLEELLQYLAKREEQFRCSSDQRAAELLVLRARQDFEMATECIIGGMYSVVFDLMRDVMEIEFLLRDFCYYEGHAQIWLTADENTRREMFKPGLLRKRYAEVIGKDVKDLADQIDYRAHSMSLHVCPSTLGGIPRGTAEKTDPVIREFCFADLFMHARNLIIQIENNMPKESRTTAESEPFAEHFLPLVFRAWQSTQLLSSMFQELLKSALDESEDTAIEKD